LNLRTLGKHVHEPRDLGQSRNASVRARNVGHVGDAVERHQVVLTHRIQFDVLDEDHLLMAQLEDRAEHIGRVLGQAREILRIGPRHTGRGIP